MVSAQAATQADLSRRRVFFAFCDLAEQINKRLIRFSSLRRKAGTLLLLRCERMKD